MQVNVAIVGLDRLSTSFGLALKHYQKQPKAEHTFTIMGSDLKAQAMKDAQKVGAIDNFNRALLKATDNADLIILNVPFSALEETYERLGSELKPGCVVLDLTLLKQPAIQLAHEHFKRNAQGEPLAYLVGITPIVHVSGLYNGSMEPEDASADLFKEADMLLMPDPKCPSEAIDLAEDIVRIIGAQPRFMDPAEHDGLISATEELPTLVGSALFFMMNRSDGWMELRRMINPTVALTFQSLRYQTPQDLQGLFMQNRANLARNLEGLIDVLTQLHDGLEEGDSEVLEAFLGQVHKAWDKWDIKRHSGKWDEVKGPEFSTGGPLGSMTGFFTIGRLTEKDKDDDED